jgi:hypothetical protein
MRKRISRHIERCEACGERKRLELTAALFAGAVPVVALIPGFRVQVLKVLADRSPAGLAHRLTVANRAGPFGPHGFPKPISPPGAGPWHHVLHHPHAIAVGAITAVVAAGAIVVGVIVGPHHGLPSAAGISPGAPVSSTSAGSAHGGPSGNKGSNGNNGGSGNGGSGNGGQGLAPSASTGGGATTPVAARSPGASSSGAPTTNPTPPTSSSAPPSAGTLSVSTGQLDLVSVSGTATGRFTLTATGGPVSAYSITVGSTLAGSISVSPSSGSLASGGSVTITVTSTSLVALDGQLTVNPGGHTITVVLSLSL